MDFHHKDTKTQRHKEIPLLIFLCAFVVKVLYALRISAIGLIMYVVLARAASLFAAHTSTSA